ncbi:hypothetical protein CEP54_011989 [Fusarium duplospermum]|uniref:Uncharacterized protein n=1 Tax=Fusarium duplospermum TaxID=1325734 RepID=A0A428PBE7_9HYPO|nr:hypothetical protein CEP54_011989 [Fusarium duplospermum]
MTKIGNPVRRRIQARRTKYYACAQLDCKKPRRYPKLRIVIQEVSENDTGFDLTKVICLPDSKAPARVAYETVAKFNANNQRRLEGNDSGSSSNQADFDTDHPCLRRSELCKSMLKAWAHHFSASSCHSHHVDGTIHEPDHPYVASTFFSDRQPVEIKDKFPILIHFAKLLLEIGLGQLFVSKRLRLDVELIRWAQSDEAKESLTQGYLEAVLECLRATKSRNWDDPMDEEIQCRKIMLSLVSHLDKARHNYRSLDPKRTQQVSMPDSTLIKLPVDSLLTQQYALSREDISDLLPKNRMFDEQKLRSCDDDQRWALETRRARVKTDFLHYISNIRSARAFLDMAERFYTSSMRGLTASPDIRIAVFDTGIHTGNSFIKGAKYSRNGQDSPIKELKSFVPKHSNDECGHGTNVASLILRISPEANLYIAKISRGVEQDGVNQIVEAIEWARSYNVHIINMFFSIPKTPEIKKTIKEAESNGVIFFVAASTNGVHAGRSFPATLDTVLCIHATDGKGNKGSMNPDPESHRDNFSALGLLAWLR